MQKHIPKAKKKLTTLGFIVLQMDVPYSSLNNTEFSRLLNGKSIIPKKELKATPTAFEKLNIFTENGNMACKYYSNEQFKKLKKDNQDKNISITFKYIFSTLSYR